MGAAELEEALRRQGDESARSIVESARRDSDALRAAAEASWVEHQRAELAEVEAEVNANTAAELMRARRAAKKRVLEARHRAIERVMDAVRTRLPHVFDRERAERALGDLRAYVATPEVEIQEREDGFILRASDGSITVDATLGRQLERSRPLLAIRIVKLIDAEAG